MTNLNIQQGQITENVSSEIIDKLYRLALVSKAENSDNLLNMSLSGNIYASTAYEDAVMYLREKFPDLTINIPTTGYFIRFIDPTISSIIINEFGNGIGVTRSQLSSVLTLNNRFRASNYSDFLEAESYDDLQYFTGLTNYTFMLSFVNADAALFKDTASYNSNVKVMKKNSFTFPKTTIYVNGNGDDTVLRGNIWNRKVEFEHIDISGVNATGSNIDSYLMTYIDCKFEDIVLPSFTEQSCRFFKSNGILGKFIYPEGVTRTIDNFNGCNVSYIEFPTTLQSFNLFSSFRRDADVSPNTGCIVFKSVTPPTHDNISSYVGKMISTIYCPANSVAAYRTWADSIVTGDSTQLLSNVQIKSMAEMSQAERDMGTVTQEDIDRV